MLAIDAQALQVGIQRGDGLAGGGG
jgi:hypothetical protein